VDIYLDNGDHNAKAVFAEISFDPKKLAYHATSFNTQLTETDRPVFVKPLQDRDKVSISAAVLGRDQVFEGSGLIATLQFNLLTSGEAELVLSDADIRDNQNNNLLGEGFISEPIASAAALPDRYELGQNHPNPFNPETEISYSLPEDTWVTIKVYNISGQLVKTLVDDVKPAGRHTVSWNGTNQSNSRVATGVYFYRMETERFQKTAKMILVK
ncbi:MAG TPA: T9SS type A sorting domain-containing protein, partial [candidate division Zixibacteria bacterium]|nr:T9SS type A sorting domain-containing protein [candidate division Zixibacteria bacterium]